MSTSHSQANDPAIELADANAALFTLAAQSVQMMEMLRDNMVPHSNISEIGLMSLNDYLDWTHLAIENWITFHEACLRGANGCFDLMMGQLLHPQKPAAAGEYFNGSAVGATVA
ncbi:MAG: hypothetical protein RL654_90 [Pseudomonadota bacterium]|jgi:hypothetical protein